MDLLKTDWLKNYGADGYKAIIATETGSPDRFATKLAERLRSDACWPTRAAGSEKFAKASDVALPANPDLDGFLSLRRYLDPQLAADALIGKFVVGCGAKLFSISSLVRLRCAGADASQLQTKVDEDANFHFTNYQESLKGVELQARFGEALTSLFRRLTKQQKSDIGNTVSTLSATGELRPASQLIIVDADLWSTCPEPEANRLHPDLVPYRAISIHCDPFDEEKWLVDAAHRAASAAEDDPERITLYKKLLTRNLPLSRAAFSALRNNPVARNQRGNWVAPADMAHLKKPLARLLDTVIDAPSREMIAAPGLLARLRIREVLKGEDLVRFATDMPQHPELAERFEKLLFDNLRLLTPAIVSQLRTLPCLRARSGALALPADLHLDTPANRLCIGNDDKIVGGAHELLSRRLKVRGEPSSETLLAIIEAHRAAAEPPRRPDLLYPALAAALARERSKGDLEDERICWVDENYHEPAQILVGSRIPLCLSEAIPVYRHANDVGRAYVELGAPSSATDEHWARLFEHVSQDWSSGDLDPKQRRILLEAYHDRGPAGLPAGLEMARCLLDDRSRLFTLTDLRAGRLVEPDFPALERALHDANSKVGIIERSARSRAFYTALGIRPLSSIASTDQPVFGLPGRPLIWFNNAKHRDRVLAMLHRPLFARALYEIAYRHRFIEAGFLPATLEAIEARLAGLQDIAFFQTIGRRYRVAGIRLRCPQKSRSAKMLSD